MWWGCVPLLYRMGKTFFFAKNKEKLFGITKLLKKVKFFMKTQSGSQKPTLKKKSHMRCNSSQCDQYFTKCVKFTFKYIQFPKNIYFISLLGKNLFTSLLSRKYDRIILNQGKILEFGGCELEVGEQSLVTGV